MLHFLHKPNPVQLFQQQKWKQLHSRYFVALLAVQILALSDPALAKAMKDWRAAQTANVAETPQ